MEDTDFEVLPIEEHKEHVISSIRENQVLVCIGETGKAINICVASAMIYNNLIQGLGRQQSYRNSAWIVFSRTVPF